MSNQELIVVEIQGENRIDSRLISKRLGIEHKAFMETVRDYQTQINTLGQVPFETEAVKTAESRGTKYSKYVMLNEDQAIFVSTLSRNTDAVVQFKLDLIVAFREARNGKSALYLINEAFARRTEYNAKFHVPGRFTVLEKTNVIALSGQLQRLGFASNAFLDTSLGRHFKTYCENVGMDMSLVYETEDYHLVGHELNDDKKTYNWKRPIYKQPLSYPDRPFCLTWEEYLTDAYWPEKFLPYIQSKYKGEERIIHIEAGEKVIGYFSNKMQQKRLF